MADLAGRLWRMSATGLCFTVFGLGGVIGRVLIFPLLRIVVRDERRRVLLARRLIRAASVMPRRDACGPSAGPLPSRPAIPSGDRPTYPSDEGLT